ncbi:hypothetical protein ACFWIA_28645 [Streptomyces sp. NPDC127068]|uniref:hypothetical protein n=1 Tax=Streptomyces sp. NPDC127068 TaxID=3347127 RepID=UPI00364F33FE
MDVVRYLVGGILLAGGLLVWRLCRYPGGWKYAFGAEYAGERAALDRARGKVSRLRSEAAERRAAAEARLREAESVYRRRVRAAELRVEGIRHPGPGQLLGQLGVKAALYEHALVVGQEELPLAGLTVRIELGRVSQFLYATLPDGSERHVALPFEEHTEDEVRGFAGKVTNTVAAEKTTLADREAQLDTAVEALVRVKAGTDAVDTARADLDRLAEAERSDFRPASARRELDRAWERWNSVTGRSSRS